MAYDSQRGRTVLFGTLGGETWEWDGTTWTRVATTGPANRFDHAMAYDSQRGRVVLFGGHAPGGGSNLFGDTWEWDGSTWTQVATTGPSARTDHAMAYDSQRGRTVLFGGIASGNNWLADTWEWNGNTWQPQLFASGPPARSSHAMAYDSQRGRTVLFGGIYGNGYLGDTWEWDGSTWVQVGTTGPLARHGHAMAYDSQRGRTVLFGGINSPLVSGVHGDTWEWQGTSWVQILVQQTPARRRDHAMAYDSQRALTVLFAGIDQNGGSLCDTWEWDGSTWMTPPPMIPGRSVPFGAGCGSPALALAPVATARPIIGTTAQASLTNIPSSLAFVELGWSRTMVGAFTLPLPLAGFGMPGCDLLQSIDSGLVPVTFTGTESATFSLPLPNLSALIGLRVYLQGFASAPGVNAGNAIVSNGVEWAIGNS